MAINIKIMIKMTINLNCNSDRVRFIYKMKNKKVRFKKEQ